VETSAWQECVEVKKKDDLGRRRAPLRGYYG